MTRRVWRHPAARGAGGTGRLVSKGLPAATAAPVPAAAASVKALKRPRVEADSEIAHPNLAPLFTVFIYGVCVVRTYSKASSYAVQYSISKAIQ